MSLWSDVIKIARAIGDSINARESATLAWLGVGLIAVLLYPTARRAFFALIKTLFSPVLLRINLLMSLWAAGSVWILSHVGLWTLANLKTTLVWWLTFAFVSFMDLQKKWDDPKVAVLGQVRELLAATVIITFVAETYTFSFWVELLLLPIAGVVAMLAVVAASDPDHAPVRKLSNGLLTIMGLAVLLHAALVVAHDPSAFLTLANLREFTTPILLSLMYLPFLFLLACYMAFELQTLRIKWVIDAPRLRFYAALRVLFAFGLDPPTMRRWNRSLSERTLRSRADIDRSINSVRAHQQREANPPPVYFEDGWSPYAAAAFLADQGLKPGDWHESGLFWQATAASREIKTPGWDNRLGYEVWGDEYIATELRLVLRLNWPQDEPSRDLSCEIFFQAVAALLHRALGADYAEAALSAIAERKPKRHEDPLYSVALTEEPRGLDDKESDLRLVITHRRHVGLEARVLAAEATEED